MIKILKLEWYKFRKYRPFTIVLGLFILTYFAVGLSIKTLLDFFVTENAEQFAFFLQAGLPIFDFVDIWQNLAYITFLFKYILAFVVIISVTVEYTNKTIRQNFIDGLSRKEYLLSKFSLIGALSLLSGAMLTLLGLVLGVLYSPVTSFDFVILNFEFVLAHMLEVFAFLIVALFLATLIRKTGFTIILFVLYALCIEPIATSVMHYQYELPIWYFPMRSISNIVSLPFPKYIFREVQDFIAIKDVLVVLGWTALFTLGTFRMIQRRDV